MVKAIRNTTGKPTSFEALDRKLEKRHQESLKPKFNVKVGGNLQRKPRGG